MAKKVLRFRDIDATSGVSSGTAASTVVNKKSMLDKTWTIGNWTRKMNFIEFGNDARNNPTGNGLIWPIYYTSAARSYVQAALNMGISTSGTVNGYGYMNGCTKLLYLSSDNRCVTENQSGVSLDYYAPYPSTIGSSVLFAFSKVFDTSYMYTNNSQLSNWVVRAYFCMQSTPIFTINGTDTISEVSNKYTPNITSSNWYQWAVGSNGGSLAYSNTCTGWMEHTWIGKPTSSLPIYQSISHHSYTRYSLTGNSDYDFYFVPTSAQTGNAQIHFFVATSGYYTNGINLHMQYFYPGSNKYIDYSVPLSYYGWNANQYYSPYITGPSGYGISLAYIYYGVYNCCMNSNEYYKAMAWRQIIGLST